LVTLREDLLLVPTALAFWLGTTGLSLDRSRPVAADALLLLSLGLFPGRLLFTASTPLIGHCRTPWADGTKENRIRRMNKLLCKAHARFCLLSLSRLCECRCVVVLNLHPR
jgi:hypothetical protein